MKRLSRRARKQKKQEEQCRGKKLSKAGIPYSKHKKRICYHFGWSGDMALGVRIYAMTERITITDMFAGDEARYLRKQK